VSPETRGVPCIPRGATKNGNIVSAGLATGGGGAGGKGLCFGSCTDFTPFSYVCVSRWSRLIGSEGKSQEYFTFPRTSSQHSTTIALASTTSQITSIVSVENAVGEQ